MCGLFAPAGSGLSDTDWQLCHILKEALHKGKLPGEIQFLIRNHPHHPADLSQFIPDHHFVIETPGSSLGGRVGIKFAELQPGENDHLRNSIYYSDIVMYVVTSLGLDATVFNKPQIMVNFDGWDKKNYIQSVQRYNREDCLASLTSLGGTKVVRDKEEWIEAINQYLSDPTMDQLGRDKARVRHLYQLDGQAGKRCAEVVLNMLQSRND